MYIYIYTYLYTYTIRSYTYINTYIKSLCTHHCLVLPMVARSTEHVFPVVAFAFLAFFAFLAASLGANDWCCPKAGYTTCNIYLPHEKIEKWKKWVITKLIGIHFLAVWICLGLYTASSIYPESLVDHHVIIPKFVHYCPTKLCKNVGHVAHLHTKTVSSAALHASASSSSSSSSSSTCFLLAFLGFSWSLFWSNRTVFLQGNFGVCKK